MHTSSPEALGLLACALQLTVAVYGLRLSHRFGAMRVGWSLFCAFASLASLHWLLSENLLHALLGRETLANLVITLTSVLLLVGLRHLEQLVRRHQAAERTAQVAQSAERQARGQLESQVSEQTVILRRTNDELKQTAERLQAEVAERESQQAQAEKTHKDMLEVSRKAGMSEVATSVLHNVGNVLNSVNVSATLVADRLAEFKVANIGRVGGLLREHSKDLAEFLTNDAKGKQIPDYLCELAKHLCDEQALLLQEIGFVRTRIDHIKEIVTTQQSYGKVAGLVDAVQVNELVEEVLRIQAFDSTDQKVEFRREYEPRLPSVVVDKHKVMQILLNLLANAEHACRESTHAEKRVLVRVTNGDERVRVVVKDNGVGIPAANLKTIFNFGFSTRKNGGHGFGLHSSALAAKELGGALSVHSDGPGTGAAFTLEIPVKEASRP